MLTPQGSEGPFFLVYPNFEYLRRWNGLELYGLTTGLLADILANYRQVHTYPENFKPIRTETIIKMQEILAQKGYNIGTPDGKLGPKTRSVIKDFQKENFVENLSDEDCVKAMKLLEIQRQAMLMYTSCGWFFSEISGIETTQIMKYAARAMQLVQSFSKKDLEKKSISLEKKEQKIIPMVFLHYQDQKFQGYKFFPLLEVFQIGEVIILKDLMEFYILKILTFHI